MSICLFKRNQLSRCSLNHVCTMRPDAVHSTTVELIIIKQVIQIADDLQRGLVCDHRREGLITAQRTYRIEREKKVWHFRDHAIGDCLVRDRRSSFIKWASLKRDKASQSVRKATSLCDGRRTDGREGWVWMMMHRVDARCEGGFGRGRLAIHVRRLKQE